MADQDDLLQAQPLEPGVQIAGVVGEAVADVGLARGAHPDQIWGQDPGLAGDVRDDVAPYVGGGGAAVQEHHRRLTHPGLGVGHVGVDDWNGRHDRCVLSEDLRVSPGCTAGISGAADCRPSRMMMVVRTQVAAILAFSGW